MNIVVLGGTGFVGGHLLPRLTNAGHRVTVLSRNRERRRDSAVVPGVRIVSCPVYDGAALGRQLRGADAVINLVGILNEPGFGGAGFRKAHVELTATLIAACRAAGVTRLLQMSALNAGKGNSHYLKTRGEGEALVRASDLNWTIFQPSVIFGAGDGLYCRFAKLLDLPVPVLPLARANARFAPVYVGDVCSAYLRSLESPKSIGHTYQLAGPRVMTLTEIARYCARQLGVTRLIFNLPGPLGWLQGAAAGLLPGKPFSIDNYETLRLDSVATSDGLKALGLTATPVEAIVPGLLGNAGKQARYDTFRASRGI